MTLSSVDDTRLVVSVLPSRLAKDDWMKPVPVKVMTVSGEPTAAEIGEMLLNDGSGFDGGVVDVPLEPGPVPPQPVSESTAPMVSIVTRAPGCLNFNLHRHSPFRVLWSDSFGP